MKGEFLSVLIRSDTFWSETALFASYSLCLIAFAILLFIFLGKRITAQKVGINHQTGAAAAVDFVLTFPIFMFILFMTIQFALIANASLHVHYAAYSAAHSARVHYFDLSSDPIKLKNSVPGLTFADNAFFYSYINSAAAKKESIDAARLALISIGSYKKSINSIPDASSEAWAEINKYIQLLSEQSGTSSASVFERKSSYVFDNQNLKLNVYLNNIIERGFESGLEVDPDLDRYSIFSVTEWPVNADLSYNYPLTLPLASKIFGEKDPRNFYYRTLNASVSVL